MATVSRGLESRGPGKVDGARTARYIPDGKRGVRWGHGSGEREAGWQERTRGR